MIGRLNHRLKIGLISAVIFIFSLLYYGNLALSFPVLFNVDNADNFAATRYLAEHHRLPVVEADSEGIRFSSLGTTRLLRPPFTYIVSALTFNASKSISSNEVSRLRLGSPVIAGTTLVVVFLGFYLAFSNIGLAFLGATVVAVLPRFVFLATCNNDDIGAIFSVSSLFCATLALRRYGARFWVLIVLASAFGLVLQTKYTAWLCLPWFATYIVLVLRSDKLLKREWRRLLKWLPILLIVFVVSGGWWAIFNMANYGVNDPSAMLQAAQIQSELSAVEPNRRGYQSQGVGMLDLLANHDQFLSKSYRSMIGYLEWIELDVGTVAYLFYAALLAIGLFSIGRGSHGRLPQEDSLKWFLLAVIISQCVFYLHHNLVRDVQPQGRYVLPTIMLGVFFLLRAITLLPDSLIRLTVGRRQYNAQMLTTSLLLLGAAALHLNVMFNYVRPVYASQAYFSKLEAPREYALESLMDVRSTASLRMHKTDNQVQITRLARGLADISLTDKFCKILPINALITLEVSSRSAGALNLRIDYDNLGFFDDVYWQSFTAGKTSVNFSVSAANCSGAKISLGANTHLLTIHSLKIAELKIHQHGKPI